MNLATFGPQLQQPLCADPRELPGSCFPGAGDPLGFLSARSVLSNKFEFSHVGAFDGQGLALGSFPTVPVQNTLTITSSFLLCALAVKLNLSGGSFYGHSALLKYVSALLFALLHSRPG